MAPGRFCFMVMPFGRKPTHAEPGKAPTEIDCNALWDLAFFPMLKALGYQPVRADEETGALIVGQMLERLYFSDLVIADLTIPNGNVYYEIGIRHAARRTGCILLAADWSRPLFDLAQMRLLRYPLPQGDVDDAAARAIQEALGPKIAAMSAGTSPMFELLPGYPGAVDPTRVSGVRDQIDALAAFQAELRALRALPPSLRTARVRGLVERHPAAHATAVVALELVRALVDVVDGKAGWQDVLDYIEGLTPPLSGDAYVREQRALALGKVGRPADAIAELLALVDVAGDTSERQGLLGGRYKELMLTAEREQRPDREVAALRRKAIEHYERGMLLDLNDFFPASNLPRLYRQRGEPGDEQRALVALQVTRAACDRAIARNTGNEWARPTLLGVAFDLGDADKAEEVAVLVRREGADAWKLDSTLGGLEMSLRQVPDGPARGRLAAVLDGLRALR